MSTQVAGSALGQSQDVSASDLSRMRYKGAWSAGTAYSVNDIVTLNNRLYSCLSAVTTALLSYIGNGSLQAGSSTGGTIALPAGSLLGDLVIQAMSVYQQVGIGISGSTQLKTVQHTAATSTVFSYVLTALDITNGFVTIPTQTGASAYTCLIHVFRNASVSGTPTSTITTTTASITPATAGFIYSMSGDLISSGSQTVSATGSLLGFLSTSTAIGWTAIGAGYEAAFAGVPSTPRVFTVTADNGQQSTVALALATNTAFPSVSFVEISTDNPTIMNTNTVAASSTAQTIPDVLTSLVNAITLTANCTATFPAAQTGKEFFVSLTQGGAGSFTMTWPGTVKWPGGTTPTLTTAVGKTDLFKFICVNGTNWLGSTLGLNY